MRDKGYRLVDISDKSDLNSISLDEARSRLKEDVSKIDINGEAKVYLLTHPSGTGKTTHIAKHLTKHGYRVLWLCAIHELANKTMEYFRDVKKDVKTAHLKSRKYMIEKKEIKCKFEYNIKHASPEEILDYCRYYCYRCRWCEYSKNLSKAEEAQVIFGMHAHLQFPDFINRYIERSDCIVIDESFSSYYVGKKDFDDYDLNAAIRKLSSIAEGESLMKRTRVNARELVRYFEKFISKQDRYEFVITDFPIVDNNLREIYNKIYTDEEFYDTKNAISIFEYLTEERVVIKNNGSRYLYFRPIKLPDNKTIIILDASGSTEFYKKMLNREVITYGSDCHIKQNAHVTQFLDEPFNLLSLLDKDYKGNQELRQRPRRLGLYYKVLKLIKTIQYKHKGMKIVIGTINDFEKKLVADKVAKKSDRKKDDDKVTDKDNDKADINKADIMHYYDVRGINDYEDHDVLIILGLPMLSFRVIATQARLLFNQNWSDKEKVEEMKQDGKSWVRLSYSKDAKGYEVPTFKFTNECIQQYYQHSVITELYQMFGRIRPYKEGKKKIVYIITNTPIPNVKVDEMITIDDFMNLYGDPMDRRSEMRDILDAIKQIPNKEFTVAQLSCKLSELTGRDRTNKYQRQHIKKLLIKTPEYFNIKITTRKHTIEKL
jgi:hypothetical protein